MPFTLDDKSFWSKQAAQVSWASKSRNKLLTTHFPRVYTLRRPHPFLGNDLWISHKGRWWPKPELGLTKLSFITSLFALGPPLGPEEISWSPLCRAGGEKRAECMEGKMWSMQKNFAQGGLIKFHADISEDKSSCQWRGRSRDSKSKQKTDNKKLEKISMHHK